MNICSDTEDRGHSSIDIIDANVRKSTRKAQTELGNPNGHSIRPWILQEQEKQTGNLLVPLNGSLSADFRDTAYVSVKQSRAQQEVWQKYLYLFRLVTCPEWKLIIETTTNHFQLYCRPKFPEIVSGKVWNTQQNYLLLAISHIVTLEINLSL